MTIVTDRWAPLEPGTLLHDRYRIVQRIVSDSWSWLYRARDTRLVNQFCMIWEWTGELSDPDQVAKAAAGFDQEAQLLASLDHPSIPAVFDYFPEGERYYLAMKYVSGVDLAEQLRRRGGRLDEATVTRWGIQICSALQYLHSLDPPILFRDLKPTKLLYDERRARVMLVDFGIALFAEPVRKGRTGGLATVGYAGPETMRGQFEPRSDLYSLGATLFYLLTGSDPQDNPVMIFDFSKSPRPRLLNPAMTAEMENILIHLVDHDPEHRPASTEAVLRMLETHETALGPRGGTRRVLPDPNETYNVCPKCRTDNRPQATFCRKCAHQLLDVTAVPEAPKEIARLIRIREGGAANETFSLRSDETLIGRTEGDIRFPFDGYISSRHARILHRDGAFFLVDESSNGTFLRILGEAQLRPGDIIRVGQQLLRFEVDET